MKKESGWTKACGVGHLVSFVFVFLATTNTNTTQHHKLIHPLFVLWNVEQCDSTATAFCSSREHAADFDILCRATQTKQNKTKSEGRTTDRTKQTHQHTPQNNNKHTAQAAHTDQVAQMAATTTTTKTATEKALWMLEGRDGMARDADGAVVVLQQQVDEHHDAQAMWLLGLCCEYGMGTQQDTQRAEQLFQQAAQQGDETAKLLVGKLKNSKKGRGCLDMDLRCEQPHHTVVDKLSHPLMCLVCATTTTVKNIGPDGADVLALMLRMHVPLTTLNLRSEYTMAKHNNSAIVEGVMSKADNKIGDEGAWTG